MIKLVIKNEILQSKKNQCRIWLVLHFYKFLYREGTSLVHLRQSTPSEGAHRGEMKYKPR